MIGYNTEADRIIMIDKTSQDIGKRIKQYRLNAGLSQVSLAEMSSIHSNTLARLERGQHRASNPTIEKLAKALGVTASDILAF
jgi:transcriptional regulator with XRE-family HTH domain